MKANFFRNTIVENKKPLSFTQYNRKIFLYRSVFSFPSINIGGKKFLSFIYFAFACHDIATAFFYPLEKYCVQYYGLCEKKVMIPS